MAIGYVQAGVAGWPVRLYALVGPNPYFMRGTVLLSHGFNSGPDANKVHALAQTARALGWLAVCLDLRVEDALGLVATVPRRVARLVDAAHVAVRPLVLVGSSMGAFTSALAALEIACDGLFLMALPVRIPGYPRSADVAHGQRAMLIHGYRDAVCSPDAALALARRCGMPALLLEDDHRLAQHVDRIAGQFSLFLSSVD